MTRCISPSCGASCCFPKISMASCMQSLSPMQCSTHTEHRTHIAQNTQYNAVLHHVSGRVSSYSFGTPRADISQKKTIFSSKPTATGLGPDVEVSILPPCNYPFSLRNSSALKDWPAYARQYEEPPSCSFISSLFAYICMQHGVHEHLHIHEIGIHNQDTNTR